MGWWKTLANINCHVIYSDNVDKNRWAGVPKRGHIAGDPTAIWWHFMSLTAFVFNFRLKYELPSNFEKTQTILLRCEELSFAKNWFAYTCRNRFDPIWCNKERKELTKATCKVIRPDCISHTHTHRGGRGSRGKATIGKGVGKAFSRGCHGHGFALDGTLGIDIWFSNSQNALLLALHQVFTCDSF